MTRFDKDMILAAEADQEFGEMMNGRKKEVEELRYELRCTKNGFRRTCIQQDIDRLSRQYTELAKAAGIE